VPGNLPFPNRQLALLWLMSYCLLLPAQIHKVDPQKTITFEAAGATAAYSLDAFLAEATAENGLVSVEGKQPGTTHVVVVEASGVQTFEVLVTTPPPHYPPGFVMPANAQVAAESGDLEARYYSSPGEIQTQVDFVKIHGNDRTTMQTVETSLVGPGEQGESRVALSSASYQIVTPRRNITLLDQYVDESPLTLNGEIVRGLHLQQSSWFEHAGYTTVATFQGLFLPVQPELVTGGGYRQPLTPNSSVTASYYHIQIPASDLIGQSGNVGAVSYKYSPRETFGVFADAGISHGVGGAGRIYYQTNRDNLVALARYEPMGFASLGANNFRGSHSDFSWTRHVTNKFDSSLTFYNNNLVQPYLKESTISSAINLNYLLTRRWAVTEGASASSFQTKMPLGPAIRSVAFPAGLAFHSKHFGGNGQYEYAFSSGRESGKNQFRASLGSGWGAFAFTGYMERDANVPTPSFTLGRVAGLLQELNLLGIKATTVREVDELLSSNSFLIASGYIKTATINLASERNLIGGTADWSSRGAHRMQVSYSSLLDDNLLSQGRTQVTGHSLSYSQSITHSDDVSLAVSVLGMNHPGPFVEYTPICSIAWIHQLKHVPDYIVPERHGTITGVVFWDEQSKGAWDRDMKPIPGVEVMLDDRERTSTSADGSYRFPGVPRGKHRIAVVYRSQDPFFFTTASDLEVDEDATADFGISHSLSGLNGQVMNDAGQGVAGISVLIRSRGSKWSTTTGADGSFLVSSLTAGDYDVQLDEDSLPVGYSTQALVEPEQVIVGAAAPGNAAFTVRAFRSISGRVLRYDSTAARYIPVIGARVTLREPGFTTETDVTGRYLFRDLAAGPYTVSVANEAQTSARTLLLGAEPVGLINVDFQIRAPGSPIPAPVMLPMSH
jgi:hypothetical protein